MAQLLQHQESVFYGKELHDCRWGILQFFGFRLRLRSTKMSDRKHGHTITGKEVAVSIIEPFILPY
jgi:hypothetical protein